MNFYQVALGVAEIYDWPQKTLAEKVSIEYNTMRNWRRRKTTNANEFEKLWKALGITPSSLALAASLTDEMMEAELEAYKHRSRAFPSPAIEWALSHFDGLETIEAVIQRKEQGLMNAYLKRILAEADPFRK